jgi:hypothetical protein
MPTITVGEDDKRYIEKLRKMMPLDKVPSVKETIELILKYLERNEQDFINWVKESEGKK